MKHEVFLRTEFNYDIARASELSAQAAGLDFREADGKAHQSFKDECDINTIVRRFGLSGELPSAARAPTYEDFTEVLDFQSAMNAVIAAEESFMLMPADVRARFRNDPGQFVDFCSDSKNRDEAIKLGLVFQGPAPPAAAPAAAVAAPASVAGAPGK